MAAPKNPKATKATPSTPGKPSEGVRTPSEDKVGTATRVTY